MIPEASPNPLVTVHSAYINACKLTRQELAMETEHTGLELAYSTALAI